MVYDTPDECAFGECPVLEQDYSLSRIHVPHQLNLNLTTRTPWEHPLTGGWSLSTVTIMRSGFPLVVTQNENPLSAYGFSHQRPANANVTGNGDPAGRGGNAISAGSVTPTTGFHLSSAPHTTDSARSPALVNWDMSLEKTARFRGRADLTLRFEFINLFNQVNWRGPRTVFGAANFGTIPGTRGFPRTFQFMAKIRF